MKLYYRSASTGNFGDDINSWLWQELLPECWTENDETTFITIGTILDIRIPDTRNKVVFGTGIGYEAIPNIKANTKTDSCQENSHKENNWDIICVRGPITAAILDIDKSKAVTDSAILIKSFFDIVPENERKGIVFMPHISAHANGVWQKICDNIGIEYLDPTMDTKMLIKRIASSKKVLADAMHAAIIADTMRVPWIPMITSVEINTIKWLDWTKSMSVDYRPIYLSQSCLYEKIKNKYFILKKKGYISTGNQVNQQQTTFSDNDIKAIIENYSNKYKNWNTHSSNLNKNYFKNKVVNFCKIILKSKLVKIILYPVEKHLFNKASKDLKQAAKTKPYLSRDKIYHEKLDKMTALLADIKEKYSK